MISCKCGCGRITKKGNVFVNGHNWRGEHRSFTEEHKKKIAIALTGKSIPEAVKQKMRGRKHTEEELNNLRGRTHTDEWKRNRKEGIAKWFSDPQNKQKHMQACNTPESIMKRRESALRSWKTDEFVRKQIKASNRCKINKAEKTLLGILDSFYPGEWKFVGDGTVIINGHCPDFINVNGQKKIIEHFGDYWHRGENSDDRGTIFAPFGYETLVIWERELKDMAAVESKIRLFHEGIAA